MQASWPRRPEARKHRRKTTRLYSCEGLGPFGLRLLGVAQTVPRCLERLGRFGLTSGAASKAQQDPKRSPSFRGCATSTLSCEFLLVLFPTSTLSRHVSTTTMDTSAILQSDNFGLGSFSTSSSSRIRGREVREISSRLSIPAMFLEALHAAGPASGPRCKKCSGSGFKGQHRGRF